VTAAANEHRFRVVGGSRQRFFPQSCGASYDRAMASRATIPLVALLLAATASADGQTAPAAPPPAAQPDGAAARAQRIAAANAALERELAAVAAFGHLDEFAAKAKELLATADFRFIRVKEGSVTDIALERYLGWNVVGPDEKQPLATDVARENHPFGAIVDLARQLRDHDIDFLLVTFPSKPELYPDLLVDLPDMKGFAGVAPANLRFLVELGKAGVEVLDLTPEFIAARHVADDPHDLLFLRDNQHWTPRAVEVAARRIGERVAAFPWFAPGPAREGVDFVVKPYKFDFKLLYGPEPPWSTPEPLRANQVRRAGRAAVEPVKTESPIVVLSDSFAEFHKNESADLSLQLFRFLGQPIDLVNPKGGAEFACRDALRRRGDQLKGKRLVIWLLCDQNFTTSREWRPLSLFE
jgi:hypothetical protein